MLLEQGIGKNHIRTLFNLNALGGVVDHDKKILVSSLEKYPNIKKHQI